MVLQASASDLAEQMRHVEIPSALSPASSPMGSRCFAATTITGRHGNMAYLGTSVPLVLLADIMPVTILPPTVRGRILRSLVDRQSVSG